LCKCLKLLELATAIILGIVEDEKCFSTLNFMKDKLRNKLMIHFDLVTHMYVQKLFIVKTLNP
jgi:hypothetical protein